MESPPRTLLEAADRKLVVRQMSPRTRDTYLNWIRRYLRWSSRRHLDPHSPDTPGPYLEWLANERGVAPSTQNQAGSALAFLFKEVLGHPHAVRLPHAKGRRKLPTVLSPEEVHRVLAQLHGPHRLVGSLLYGSGLRLGEGLAMRIKDVEFEPPLLTVREGKGGQDRTTVLARFTVRALRHQIEHVTELHARDLEQGAGWAALPKALHRKSPNEGHSLAWQFLFPATKWTRDPATGRLGRSHLHPSSVQRAFKDAVRASGITRAASCHTLRHSFATHALRMGYDIHVLKELLGHKDVKTTMIYLHLVGRPGVGLTSPLDRLMES